MNMKKWSDDHHGRDSWMWKESHFGVFEFTVRHLCQSGKKWKKCAPPHEQWKKTWLFWVIGDYTTQLCGDYNKPLVVHMVPIDWSYSNGARFFSWPDQFAKDWAGKSPMLCHSFVAKWSKETKLDFSGVIKLPILRVSNNTNVLEIFRDFPLIYRLFLGISP